MLYNLQSEKCLHKDGRAVPHRLTAGLLLRNPGFHPGPVNVIFGTGTGFSRSTSVFLSVSSRTTPHTHLHSHTTVNQNLPTKVTIFGNKESSRQNNTLITFSLQNVNVASKRHSLDILHCLIEEKKTRFGGRLCRILHVHKQWSGFHHTSLMWWSETLVCQFLLS